MPIEQVVDVQITRETAAVEQQGFGRALVLGLHTRFAERFRLYEDTAGMLADGFLVSDPEYKAAVPYFSQELKPEDLLVGRRLTPVAQVSQVNVVTVTNAFNYTTTINGVVFAYLSDGSATAGEIRDGLIAAINAGAEPVTASVFDADTLALTADNAGEAFTLAVGTGLTITAVTASHGVAEDLTELQNLAGVADSWYGLVLTSRNAWDVEAGAAYVEQRRRIFVTASSDATIKTAAVTDIASVLQALAYARTAVIFSADVVNFPDAALLGSEFPRLPGSSTYANKTLVGILPDVLTASERAFLESKNVTYYQEIGGNNITQGGKVAEGEYIDVIVGVDWIEARMEEEVFALLVSVPKVPFTDTGISQVGAQMRAVLQQAETNGILASDGESPAFAINLPLASSFTALQKQSRNLTNITFTGLLAGAVHAVAINGKVSV